jgi:hypothetical protein
MHEHFKKYFYLFSHWKSLHIAKTKMSSPGAASVICAREKNNFTMSSLRRKKLAIEAEQWNCDPPPLTIVRRLQHSRKILHAARRVPKNPNVLHRAPTAPTKYFVMHHNKNKNHVILYQQIKKKRGYEEKNVSRLNNPSDPLSRVATTARAFPPRRRRGLPYQNGWALAGVARGSGLNKQAHIRRAAITRRIRRVGARVCHRST